MTVEIVRDLRKNDSAVTPAIDTAPNSILRPIAEVAAAAGLLPEEIDQFGAIAPRSSSRRSRGSPTT